MVLSYHSLEDRAVKREFQRLAQEGTVKVLTRKVIVPEAAEVRANPRARSAKMRVAEKRAVKNSNKHAQPSEGWL